MDDLDGMYRARPDRGRAGDLPAPRRLDRRLVAEPTAGSARCTSSPTPASTRSRSLATCSRSRSRRSGSSSTAASSRSCSSAATSLDRRSLARGTAAVDRCDHRRGERAALAGARRRSRRDDEEAVGFAEGSIATTARHRLVATATVDALRQLEPAAECIDVDHAQIVRVGAHDIAVVTVVFVTPPSEQLVSGSAIVRPQQESRRGRPCRARRDQPAPGVRQPRRDAPLNVVRRCLSSMAWRRRPWSCRSASAVTTASPSRPASGTGRWASSASKRGASRARSKTTGDPTTSCCPALAIDAAGRPRRRTTGRRRRDRGRAARRRSRDRRQPLLAAAQPRRRARGRPGRGRASRPGRRSATTTCRGSAGTSRTSSADFPPRVDGRAARDDQPAQPARARGARLRGRRRPSTTTSTSTRRPATAPATRNAVRLRRRRVRRVPAGARDRAQERARRGAVRAAASPRLRDPTVAPLGRRARPKTATRETLERIIERVRRAGDARSRRADVADAYAGVRPRRVPVDVGGVRQPGHRVDRVRGARARRFRIPCSPRSSRPACACFSTEQPDVLVRFLAEPDARRETYFDVNLRRAALSFALADLPARDRPGVRRARLDRVVNDDPVLARRARIARIAALGKRIGYPALAVAIVGFFVGVATDFRTMDGRGDARPGSSRACVILPDADRARLRRARRRPRGEDRRRTIGSTDRRRRRTQSRGPCAIAGSVRATSSSPRSGSARGRSSPTGGAAPTTRTTMITRRARRRHQLHRHRARLRHRRRRRDDPRAVPRRRATTS